MEALEEELPQATEDFLIRTFIESFYLIRLVSECSNGLPCLCAIAQIHNYYLYQRGAGKSTPHACLEQNTTWDLIDDIEKLREHLEITEWQVILHHRLCSVYIL